MQQFNQQRVLVVGGSSGIGEAIAAEFIAAGAEVTIASRSEEKLRAAAGRLGRVRAVQLDTGDERQVADFFAADEAWDHLAISASQTATGPVARLPLEQAYAAMDSKFWGAYRVARAAKITPHGSLTLISGVLSTRPGTNVLQGAINAALESLGRGLALELSPVRVNTVSPGVIATPLWAGMSEEARQQLFDAQRATLPAKTLGQPQDVARAVLFLAGNPFSTGSTILVDGGGAIKP